MQTIYMDNASTSFPKAPGVGEAMMRYVNEIGANVSRGAYASALSAENAMLSLREGLCELYHADGAENCILTPGATYSLNMILKGYLKPGDRVLASAMEHNAVMRPLRQLKDVTVEILPCRPDGSLDPAALEKALTVPAAMVCVTAASNVCGTLIPLQALGDLCCKRHIPLVADASQTAGHWPMDLKEAHLSALAFSAHKGLLGPQGIGAALLEADFAKRLSPMITGGTGSRSDLEIQPAFLPDKLEAGTPNLPGVYGWLAALSFYRAHQAEICQREAAIQKRFLKGVSQLDGVRLLGLDQPEGRVNVFSLDFERRDNGEIDSLLETEYGVQTRSGLHCAPLAHKALGTFPKGTVRFSPGWQTTDEAIDRTLDAINRLA